MSHTKRWLEDLSVEMGLDGEITDAVLAEAERKTEANRKWNGEIRYCSCKGDEHEILGSDE